MELWKGFKERNNRNDILTKVHPEAHEKMANIISHQENAKQNLRHQFTSENNKC